MELTRQQLKRANRVLYFSIIILSSILILFNLMLIASNDPIRESSKVFIAIFSVLLAFVILIYLKFSYMKYSRYITTIIWFVVASIGLSTTTVTSTFSLNIIIMVASVAYIDVAMAVFSNVGILLLVGGFSWYQLSNGIEKDPVWILLDLFILCFVAITNILLVKMFTRLYNEDKQKIEKSVSAQMESVEKVSGLADDVSRIFKKQSDSLGVINQRAEKNRVSMHKMGASMDRTAQDIQKQALATQDIQRIIESTKRVTGNVKDTADTVLNTVKEGNRLSGEFSEQSQNVSANTEQMSEMMQVLSEKVRDVSNITEAIMGISRQTNLLALNASIEAARAGAAGKGFGVVADQIRRLSDDTRTFTVKISDIVSELTDAAENMAPILELSVQSIHTQIENANQVNHYFSDTGEAMNHLNTLLEELRSDVVLLAESNESIVEGINQLQGTTQEVTETSKEAMNISDAIIGNMGDFSKQINQVGSMIDEMVQTVRANDTLQEDK